ncbi:hypothetical protein MC885_002319 [Smutsia gigantea]|nr:hypothetical protein MC885_002319 [Smutsia gigantea]
MKETEQQQGTLKKEGLSKCGRCKQAFYCNVECQKEDWPMHKLECSPMVVFGENWNPSETVRLTARILAKQKIHPERTPSEKLLAVKEFESHLDKLDNEKKELIQSDIAALHHFYSKHLEFPDTHGLVVLFAQVNCNGFTIEDEELSHLGSAIFPDVALMNHSCCPNVIVTYKGTLAEVRAVQEIHPGEEVFTSYIDLLYPTEDRNDRLRDSYFFTCECQECTTKDKDKAKVEIRKLSDPPEAEAVHSMVRYARSVIEEFRRAKHYNELLEICELSQEKMSSVFEDSNVYMLHMMYQAMGVCLYMQDWEGALRYGQKIIKPYSKHYPLYSLNVASMWLKLGRLYMANGNPRKGVKSWVKRGCNNKLPLENETNRCGSKKREQMHAKEKRICREMGPWEGGWGRKDTHTKPPFWPPTPGTDSSSASPLTSSEVTMAITFTPCSHTICQKSWHVCGRGP